jgi:hypothetical protein
VQLIQSFERRRIASLGKPDRFRLRNLPTVGSSRSGHATRRDASFNAMRQPLWKLSLLFLRRNYPACKGNWQLRVGPGSRAFAAVPVYFLRNAIPRPAGPRPRSTFLVIGLRGLDHFSRI